MSYLPSTTERLGYESIAPARTAFSRTKQTNEERFWKKFQMQLVQQSVNPITCVSSNHNAGQLLVFGHGRTATVVVDSKVTREITTFKETLTAVCVRPDSTVMACGGESGTIQVLDTKEKFRLRTFTNHKKRINCIDYVSNDLYSCADDMVIRHFDVAAGSVVHSYEQAHQDYIKCVKSLEDNHVLSGSYDHTIKLFDFRVHQAAQIEFNHQEPVEWIDPFPSKLMFAACGGTKVSIWDVRMGKALLTANNHKKVVSCVRVISAGSRIMTSSYDNHLKVYKSDSLQVTYQEKLTGQITTFDVSENGQAIGLGVEGGKIMLKTRSHAVEGDSSDDEPEEEVFGWLRNNEKNKFAYNDKYFYRGIYDKQENYDLKFTGKEKKKDGAFDKMLKKFQYKDALLLALVNGNMMMYLSLVDEYLQRGCLQRTLRSFTQQERSQLLHLVAPLLHNHKYAKTTVHLLITLAEEASIEGDQIREHIGEQLEVLSELNRLDGMLEFVETAMQ